MVIYSFHLLKVLISKNLIYLWRYRFNMIIGIVIMVLLILGTTYSIHFFHNDNTINDNTTILKVLGGFIAWNLMTSSFSGIISQLTNESTLGTLEQLYINSLSFVKTIIFQGIANLLIILFQLFVIVFILSFFINDIDVLFLLNFIKGIPIILLGIPAMWGLSLCIGAFALNFKNINALYSAISSIVFAWISYQVHFSKILSLILPFGLANLKLQEFYSNLIYPDYKSILFIILNSLFFMILGIVVFKYYEVKAKNSGKFAKH